MLDWFKRLNRRYDRIKEPDRFFVAMAVCMLPLLMMNSKNLCTSMIGMVAVIALIFSRILWLKFLCKSPKKEPADG